MIRLPNGSTISDIVISTALGHGCEGLFLYCLMPGYKRMLAAIRETRTTVIAESSTPQPNQGNIAMFDPSRPWTIVKFIISSLRHIKRLPDGGMVNAHALSNKGIRTHLPEIQLAALEGMRAVPNIHLFLNGKSIAQTVAEAVEMSQLVASTTGLPHNAMEWNWSCPNVPADNEDPSARVLAARKAARARHPSLTFIDKMSMYHDTALMREMEKAGNSVFHLFNTIPYSLVFPGRPSPIKGAPGGGGYSGKISRPTVMKALKACRIMLSSPIIMGHAVESEDDYKAMKDIGANSVSICKTAILNPKLTTRLIEKYNT